jgi:chromosome segregation ATPase
MTLATPDPIRAALGEFEGRLLEREARLLQHIDERFEESARALKFEFAGLIDAIDGRLHHLEVEYEMVKAGMARIEADVAILKTAYADLTAAFEDQRRALERLEGDVAVVKAAVARLEEGQAEDREDRRRLRREVEAVEAVRHRVDDLEARVRDLEARIATR